MLSSLHALDTEDGRQCVSAFCAFHSTSDMLGSSHLQEPQTKCFILAEEGMITDTREIYQRLRSTKYYFHTDSLCTCFETGIQYQYRLHTCVGEVEEAYS